MTQQTVAANAPDGRVRDLGAAEYLLYLLEQSTGSCHLVRFIEFDGTVDPDLMERAFRNMVARRLILRARIPAAPPGERPHISIDESIPPVFEVIDRIGPDESFAVFQDELNIQLGVDGDPPVRARLITSGEPGGELIVSCLHTFCDGRSLFHFCRQLLSEYEALARGGDGDASINTTGISPAVEDILPAWGTDEAGKALLADYFGRQAALPRPMPWPSQRGSSTELRQSHVLPMDLSPDELSSLRANARANGTTVLGALGAAEVLAIDDVLRPSPDEHIVAVTTLDIRDDLSQKVSIEDMGTYAAVITSRHSNVRATSEWDHARDFKTQVTDGISRNDHYAFVFGGKEWVDHLTSDVGDPMYTGTMANLGAVDLPSDGTVLRPRVIRGSLGMHHSYWPFVSFNGITINGRLAMTITYQNPEISDERAREFVTAYEERMRWYARSTG
jgi:hypothetical protein